MKYALRSTGDGGYLFYLGSSVKTVMKKMSEHFEDVTDFPEDYDEQYIETVTDFLSKNFDTVEDIQREYNDVFSSIEEISFDEM